MSNYNLQKMMGLLPYKLKKRINKTAEGRSGNEIYKRRNRRDYRVVMQYTTWEKLVNSETEHEILNEFKEGYVVAINPEEYFGDNYPNLSKYLDKKFKLGETGFILYTVLSDFNKYPPKEEWDEVYELNTKGKPEDDDTWAGDFVLNIKNGNHISPICETNRNRRRTEEIQEYVKTRFELNIPKRNIPIQAGLGNYDYDYANSQTMENVKYQMLYLVLTCKSHCGDSFAEYIYDNFEDIKDRKDSKVFIRMMNSTKGEYISKFNNEFKKFEEECKRRELLDFDKLQELGVWSTNNSRAICPLCHKPVYVDEFFDDVKQMEGRQVIDNTQKSIVLMHVDALRPGKLNHRHYNLGWGHNYCNLIQGDKDISETIDVLKEIFESHHINF